MMDKPKKGSLDSLFDVEYPNTQPLRKYEPLIRVTLDGKPLPRKLLDPENVNFHPSHRNETQSKASEAKPESKTEPQQPQPSNERKRSPPPNNEPKLEPKKKQAKSQSKITSFFNKS